MSPRNWFSRGGRMMWRFLMSVGVDPAIGYVGGPCSYVFPSRSSSSSSSLLSTSSSSLSGGGGGGNGAGTNGKAFTDVEWPKDAPVDIEDIAKNTNILPPCVHCRALGAIHGGLPKKAMFPMQKGHLSDATRPETARYFLQVGMPIPLVQEVMNRLAQGYKIVSLLATAESMSIDADSSGPGDVLPMVGRGSSGNAKSGVRGCRRMIEDAAEGRPLKAQQFTGCPVSAALLDGCKTSRAALEHIYGQASVACAERELLFVDAMGGRSAVSGDALVEGVCKACGSLCGTRWPIKYPTQWTRQKFRMATGNGKK